MLISYHNQYLGISTVKEEIKGFTSKHEAKLHFYVNEEALQLLYNQNQKNEKKIMHEQKATEHKTKREGL